MKEYNYVDPDDSIEDSDIIDAETVEVKKIDSIDDAVEEVAHKRRDKSVSSDFAVKLYALGLACGIAIGMGSFTLYHQWKSKPDYVKKEPVSNGPAMIKPSNGIILSEKGHRMLFDGFKEISRKHDGWYDGRVWSGMCEILGNRGDEVLDQNVKKVIDDILSPKTPMGRLLAKYRGPKTAPEPSQQDEDKFGEAYEEYERYQPIIDALFDENYDDETTREERNRGLYKILYQ